MSYRIRKHTRRGLGAASRARECEYAAPPAGYHYEATGEPPCPMRLAANATASRDTRGAPADVLGPPADTCNPLQKIDRVAYTCVPVAGGRAQDGTWQRNDPAVLPPGDPSVPPPATVLDDLVAKVKAMPPWGWGLAAVALLIVWRERD